MPPSRLAQELERVGGMLNRWQAELRFVLFAAGILLALMIFSFMDLYLQYERIGRIATWCLLVGIGFYCLKVISKSLAEKHSTMGLAAEVELSFPELDNHLINFLQFSMAQDNDPFKKAYIQRGVPEWNKIQLTNMKDKKKHKRANIVLVVSLLLLVCPFFFNGNAWGTAIWRIVNPFSNVRPVSLTNIVSVEPGDSSELIGSPLVLTCKVVGRKGHKVAVDITPSDDEKTTFSLGNIAGDGEEVFHYRLPKVTTDLKYRFRAGDSPSPEWYKVKARSPLALNSVKLVITPPGYTRAEKQTLNGLEDELFILQGSRIEITMECNSPLTLAAIESKGEESINLKKSDKETVWTGVTEISSGGIIKIMAKDTYGDELQNEIKYTLVPDKPPVIDIVSPQGHTMLPPGSDPLIEFAVVDDYGLATVTVEKLAAGADGIDGKVMKTWTMDARDFQEIWKGEIARSQEKQALSYRIQAKDNCPYTNQVTKSTPILFNAMDLKTSADLKDKINDKVNAALSQVVEMQRDNIEATKKYQDNIDLTTDPQWVEASEKQEKIRTLTKALITNPLNPLGALADKIKKCYMEEMVDAPKLLKQVAEQTGFEQVTACKKALGAEEKILRALTSASAAAEQVAMQQKISELTAMLAGLLKGQKDVITQTDGCVKNSGNVPGTLTDKQEELGSDLAMFAQMCESEAVKMENNNAAYAACLRTVATGCAEKKIKDDMMIATDKLDGNKAKDALEPENSALTKLKEIQAEFEAQKASADDERLELMQDTFQFAKEQVGKAMDLQAKAIESMDAVDPNKKNDNKAIDLMEEEYQELVKNSKEALLQVPIDLNIFLELNTANDIVEDVVSVFEEIEQTEGTEDDVANGKITEMAFAKEEMVAEMMEEAEGNIDDLEQWLMAEPDTIKMVQEALDQEEMPEEGMALGALKTQAEDLISDLLDTTEDEEELEEADDSPTNKGVPDMEMGGPIIEGDVTSFAAKGKSGNEKPDHKEQDGRSNVGRQGMSNGETAAGSGTIQEGDPNIEARRTDDPTQSGQVDVDGEADTKATGGGKQGTGKADGVGDAGGEHRMDSTEAGSAEGMEAMMSKVEMMYAQASLKGVRSAALNEAAHHIRQAKDAIAQGHPEQVEEFKKKAVAALKKASTELGAGASMALDGGKKGSVLEDVVEAGVDNAPSQYRDMVSEYYKQLNDI